MLRNSKSGQKHGGVLKLRDAALRLGVSFSTIKQWVYENKIRSLQTAGDITASRRVKLTGFFSGREAEPRWIANRQYAASVAVTNWRVDAVRVSGLMAGGMISIGGQQITSMITARSAREMQLKPGQTAAALVKATEVMTLRV